jgi:two-component system LytT family response regulator
MRVVVVDDEKHARESILRLIEFLELDINVVGEADSVASAVEVIRDEEPELVLLDIRLPDGNGFDVISAFDNKVNFKLIFITAYDEYAIKAFKFNAVDYILKPIDPDDFSESISKVIRSHENGALNERLQIMMKEMSNPSPKEEKKIIIKNIDAIHIVEVKNIIRCESERNYTAFTIIDDGNPIKLLASKHMKEFEEVLQEYDFYRVHQSHLINIDHVKYFDREKNICVMKDKSEVPISVRKRDQLFKLFKTL